MEAAGWEEPGCPQRAYWVGDTALGTASRMEHTGTETLPEPEHDDTKLDWRQCLWWGMVSLTQAGDNAMDRHGGTDRGQSLGLGTGALNDACLWGGYRRGN